MVESVKEKSLEQQIQPEKTALIGYKCLISKYAPKKVLSINWLVFSFQGMHSGKMAGKFHLKKTSLCFNRMTVDIGLFISWWWKKPSGLAWHQVNKLLKLATKKMGGDFSNKCTPRSWNIEFTPVKAMMRPEDLFDLFRPLELAKKISATCSTSVWGYFCYSTHNLSPHLK